ncbi:hypothetical protein, partial [Saccharicrinis sp. GN24d3]|uniref:hypothetical protein n=1 Tax=Saccharicrinis sp. GN24d3 TaxID=3458416 RepID=UPI0040367326
MVNPNKESFFAAALKNTDGLTGPFFKPSLAGRPLEKARSGGGQEEARYTDMMSDANGRRPEIGPVLK